MKSERLNNVILLVSAIVFILQSIGYFAPAWFIKEVVVSSSKNGMVADKRHFKLPYWDELFENEDPSPGSMSVPSPEDDMSTDEVLSPVINKNETRLFGAANSFSNMNHNDGPTHTIDKRSVNRPPRPARPSGISITEAVITNIHPDTTEEEAKKKGNNDSQHSERVIEESQDTEVGNTNEKVNDVSQEKAEGDSKEEKDSTTDDTTIEKRGDEETKERVDKSPKKPVIPVLISDDPAGTPILDAIPDKTGLNHDDARITVEKAIRNEIVVTKRKYILYLSAGMWYSRACIYSTSSSAGIHSAGNNMEWCALYIRTDDRTLEMKNSMFEFRLETTIALAASLLSLVLASTGCCSHRRSGTRAIASLSTMFVSGGVMAVPVVHMILGHIELHGHVMGQDRKNMTIHHLFDHYSVIVCGAASVLAILSTLVITIVKCRSNSSPSNWYDVRHDDKTKTELPINWVHNPKTAVPAVTMIKEITRDETESGYCEMPEDDVQVANVEALSDTSQKDANDFGQLELVPSELETFEM